jgi:hypothetical protein
VYPREIHAWFYPAKTLQRGLQLYYLLYSKEREFAHRAFDKIEYDLEIANIC